MMTVMSLIFGVLAAFYLFQNYWLFFIFALLHFLADGLDGVLARLNNKVGKTNNYGKYFDLVTDRLVALAFLTKLYLVIMDYYILIIIGIYLFTHLIYFLSQMNYPVFFTRTTILIILLFSAFFTVSTISAMAYLMCGVLSLYSLFLQFNHYLSLRRN